MNILLRPPLKFPPAENRWKPSRQRTQWALFLEHTSTPSPVRVLSLSSSQGLRALLFPLWLFSEPSSLTVACSYCCYLAFFYSKPICLTVPSFNKQTPKITWTLILKSFLYEVNNPHIPDPHWPGAFLVTIQIQRKIHPPSKFSSIQYSSVNHRHHATQQIPRTRLRNCRSVHFD